MAEGVLSCSWCQWDEMGQSRAHPALGAPVPVDRQQQGKGTEP